MSLFPLPVSGSGPTMSMPLDANNLKEESPDAGEGVSDVTLLDWRWHLKHTQQCHFSFLTNSTLWRLSDRFCHTRSDPLTGFVTPEVTPSQVLSRPQWPPYRFCHARSDPLTGFVTPAVTPSQVLSRPKWPPHRFCHARSDPLTGFVTPEVNPSHRIVMTGFDDCTSRPRLPLSHVALVCCQCSTTLGFSRCSFRLTTF